MSNVWSVLDEKELLCLPRLRVAVQHIRLSDGREVSGYLRFTTEPYVVIFALTPEHRVICERHYKHGPRRVVLTLPAGGIEEGEAPLQAAKRELLEETGYASDDWRPLSVNLTHANAGGSVFHVFLARNCHELARPTSDDLEEITIEIRPIAAILGALAGGDMPGAADATTIMLALLALNLVSTE